MNKTESGVLIGIGLIAVSAILIQQYKTNQLLNIIAEDQASIAKVVVNCIDHNSEQIVNTFKGV